MQHEFLMPDRKFLVCRLPKWESGHSPQKQELKAITLLPYFEGERTPNRPNATGVFTGLNLSNSTVENIARAMFEGMLCGLVDAVHHLEVLGVDVKRILIIGGAAKNPAVGMIASSLFGKPVYLPKASEYVADGAAKQIATTLLGSEPTWGNVQMQVVESKSEPFVFERYRTVVEHTSGLVDICHGKDWSSTDIAPERSTSTCLPFTLYFFLTLMVSFFKGSLNGGAPSSSSSRDKRRGLLFINAVFATRFQNGIKKFKTH